MSTQATYIGVTPRTVVANDNNATISIGLRVVQASDGTVALADHTVRGDFVALTNIEAGKPGLAASMQSAGRVVAIAGEAVNQGDTAYSFDNGQTGKTSGGGQIELGKWSAATAINQLGCVELTNPL